MDEKIRTPVNRLDTTGAIRRWLLLGPFPNATLPAALPDGTERAGLDTDFLRPLGGESGLHPSSGNALQRYTAESDSRGAGACVVTAQPNDNIDLSVVYPGSQFHVAYGFCFLESDSDRTVHAYFGSKDGAKIWLNGELVHRLWTRRRAVRPWTDAFPLRVRRGTNSILVKVENAGDEWAFVLHLYRQADHLPAMRARVRSLSLKTDALAIPADGAAPVLLVQTRPRILGLRLAIRLEVLDGEGRCRKEIRCRTDDRTVLPLAALEPGFITLRACATEPRFPAVTGEIKLYLGDLDVVRSRLLVRVERLLRYQPEKSDDDMQEVRWSGLHLGILEFARWWLGPAAFRRAEADLYLFEAFERMADALEAGRSDLTGQLGRLHPIKFASSGSQPFEPAHYFAYLPKGYGESGRGWPLLVFLSGAGAVGDDIQRLKQHDLVKRLVDDRDYPLLVVAPQCPEGKDWHGREPEHLDAFLDDVRARFSVDPERILVTGISMGARGAWEWAAARPHRFAGVVPVCGRLDPTLAPGLSELPMWIWHGDCDGTVPIYYADLAVSALRKAGSAVRYSVIEGEGHDAWDHAYRTPALVRWMLDRRRRDGDDVPGSKGQRMRAVFEPVGLSLEPGTAWCYLNAVCGIETLHRTLYLKLIELFGRLRFHHGRVAGRYAEVVFQDLAETGPDAVRFLIGVPLDEPLEGETALSQGYRQSLYLGEAEYRGPVCDLPNAFAVLARQLHACDNPPVGIRGMRVRYLNRDVDDLDALLMLGASEAESNGKAFCRVRLASTLRRLCKYSRSGPKTGLA